MRSAISGAETGGRLWRLEEPYFEVSVSFTGFGAELVWTSLGEIEDRETVRQECELRQRGASWL